MSAITEPTSEDRILDGIRNIIRTEIATLRLKYAGYFNYTIAAVNGEPPNVLIDCRPTDPSLDLPDLSQVAMQPGIDGVTSIPSSGMNCVVEFLNRDPGLPRIVGVDSLGVNPVARLGDQVTCFVPPLMPFFVTASIIGPFAGFASMSSPITGVITQGSGKVFTG